MKKSSVFLTACLIILILSNAACTQAQTPATTQPPDAAYTASIQTIVAGLTLSAPTITNPLEVSGNTPGPTVALPIPSEFVVTNTPEATMTSQPSATLEYTPTTQPTNTTEPTATPEPTEPATFTPIPKLVFQDSFSSKSSWTKETWDNYGFDFVDGGYQIFVKIKDVPIWSIRTNAYPDVQLEVDTMDVEGTRGGYYGLVCRHTGGANFYALVIGSDGFYGIGKKGSGVFTFLKQGALPAEANLKTDAANRIRADCIGNSLSLFVNGLKVAEVQDKEYSTGDVGMVVGARSRGTVTILFDSFVVFAP